jgi:hypothetical protein
LRPQLTEPALPEHWKSVHQVHMCEEPTEDFRPSLAEPSPPPRPTPDHPLAGFYRRGGPWWCQGGTGSDTLPVAAVSYL